MDAFFCAVILTLNEVEVEGPAFSSHLHKSGCSRFAKLTWGFSFDLSQIRSFLHPTLAAGRRNNPIHPQIHHHLPVVIHGVRNAERSQSAARPLSFSRPLN